MPRLVAEDIARTIKHRIDSGEWSEANRVPPERALAASFGVARNTIRRAMAILTSDGAISRHVGRGTFIAPADVPSIETAPSLGDAIARMAGASPADMMEVRLLLEPAAAAVAATDANLAQLAHVEEAHRAAAAAVEMPAFEYWDAEFHHRVFACSRNELLREINNVLGRLRGQPAWHDLKLRSFSQERRRRYAAEHEAIMDALNRRDPEAARSAMHTHLRTVEANLLNR